RRRGGRPVGEHPADAIRDRDQMPVAREDHRPADAADDDAADQRLPGAPDDGCGTPNEDDPRADRRAAGDGADEARRRGDEQRAVLLRDDDAPERAGAAGGGPERSRARGHGDHYEEPLEAHSTCSSLLRCYRPPGDTAFRTRESSAAAKTCATSLARALCGAG